MIAEYLRDASIAEWNRYINHEFIQEMKDGSLQMDDFKFYLIQDSLYVSEMLQSVLRSASRMPQAVAVNVVNAVFSGRDRGMEAHTYLEKELGIDGKGRMTFTTYEYTRHLYYASNLGWPEFLASWIPCMWGYSYIGKYVAKSSNRYFAYWADFYASNEYMERVNVILEALESYAGDPEYLKDYFYISLKYEQRFWQSALDHEEFI